MSIDVVETCIVCNRELVLWERNRSECMDCRYQTAEAYSEELEEEDES